VIHEGTDLLGQPLPPPETIRKDGRRRKIGYAARPGTGPRRQRCGTCKFASRVVHHDEVTHKCELKAHLWRHDATTDINLRAPACSEWSAKPFRALTP
jgi:hypothetical protein